MKPVLPDTPQNMLKILEKNYKKYLNYRGVFYVDVGNKYKKGKRINEICLRFHVSHKHSKTFLGKDIIPKIIDGMKTDVIISHPVNHQRIEQRFEELSGGIEIRNSDLFGSGTLGAIFLNENNELVGLSNHHVLVGDDDLGRRDDDIIQPNLHNATTDDIIGKLNNWDKKYDCAIFTINDIRANKLGFIIGFQNQISGFKDPEINDLVKKSGVATDITFGIIDGISADDSFSIVLNPAKSKPGDIIASSGDSGSLWVLDQDTSTIVVGLHWGGDTGPLKGAKAFNINKVMKSLNIKLNI